MPICSDGLICFKSASIYLDFEVKKPINICKSSGLQLLASILASGVKSFTPVTLFAQHYTSWQVPGNAACGGGHPSIAPVIAPVFSFLGLSSWFHRFVRHLVIGQPQ